MLEKVKLGAIKCVKFFDLDVQKAQYTMGVSTFNTVYCIFAYFPQVYHTNCFVFRIDFTILIGTAAGERDRCGTTR